MHPTAHSASREDIASVRSVLEQHDIERVLAIGADVHGQSRGKFIPRWRFEKDPTEPMHIADVLAIMDIEDDMMPRPEGFTGWWPTWDTGFADWEAVPDLSSFSPAPWIDGGAVVLCDYFNHDGSPVNFMPRGLSCAA